MTETIATSCPAARAHRGLPWRLLGVLTSPRATFADVAVRPHWAGVFAVVLLVAAAGAFIFFSTQVGRRALIDQMIRSRESFGSSVTDEQYQRFEQFAPVASYALAAIELVGLPIVALMIAGVAFAVFNGLAGGDAAFRQVFAVVAHSGVVIAFQQILVLPLDYARESLSSPTALSVFLPFLDENTFLARLLGTIDLVLVWWTITLAIGLGVLYRRRTRPIATSMLAIYVAIALVVSGIKSALSGA